MLITIGLTLIFIDKIAKNNVRNYHELNKKNALIIGLSQILAFARGCSRSGILTISGTLQSLSLKQAAKYSFLAGIPIIAAATIYQILDFIKSGSSQIDILNLFMGLSFSFLTSIISIRFLLSIVERYGVKYFGYYRIVLAIILLFIYM